MAKKSSITFTTFVHRNEKLMNVHYLEVPKNIMEKMEPKARLLCSVNEHKAFQCGIVSLGQGKGYITVNNKRMKEFGIEFGERVSVKLTPDKSEYGLEMPEELSVLLEQDPEGMERFKKLPAGKQRYIIFYVAQVKSPQLRIDRSVKLITNLKSTKPGKESFRAILGMEPRK